MMLIFESQNNFLNTHKTNGNKHWLEPEFRFAIGKSFAAVCYGNALRAYATEVGGPVIGIIGATM